LIRASDLPRFVPFLGQIWYKVRNQATRHARESTCMGALTELEIA
ncbi:hypothetical protein HMPREF1577_01468, partial [Gardnerella pickettii JCP8017A]